MFIKLLGSAIIRWWKVFGQRFKGGRELLITYIYIYQSSLSICFLILTNTSFAPANNETTTYSRKNHWPKVVPAVSVVVEPSATDIIIVVSTAEEMEGTLNIMDAPAAIILGNIPGRINC